MKELKGGAYHANHFIRRVAWMKKQPSSLGRLMWKTLHPNQNPTMFEQNAAAAFGITKTKKKRTLKKKKLKKKGNATYRVKVGANRVPPLTARDCLARVFGMEALGCSPLPIPDIDRLKSIRKKNKKIRRWNSQEWCCSALALLKTWLGGDATVGGLWFSFGVGLPKHVFFCQNRGPKKKRICPLCFCPPTSMLLSKEYFFNSLTAIFSLAARLCRSHRRKEHPQLQNTPTERNGFKKWYQFKKKKSI